MVHAPSNTESGVRPPPPRGGLPKPVGDEEEPVSLARISKKRAIPAIWTLLRLVRGGHSRGPGIPAAHPKAMVDRDCGMILRTTVRAGTAAGFRTDEINPK